MSLDRRGGGIDAETVHQDLKYRKIFHEESGKLYEQVYVGSEWMFTGFEETPVIDAETSEALALMLGLTGEEIHQMPDPGDDVIGGGEEGSEVGVGEEEEILEEEGGEEEILEPEE